MKLAGFIAVTLLAFVLAGCGGGSGISHAPNSGSDSQSQPAAPENPDVILHSLSRGSGDFYYWTIANIKMPSGKNLVCMRVEAEQDNPISISCNWEAYNK